MKLTWILFGDLVLDAQGNPDSNYASVRYRALLPARELSRHGWTSRFEVVAPPADQHRLPAIDLDADALIFCKSFHPFNEILIKRAREAGIHTVFDVSDNYFNDGAFANHFRAMAVLADTVTAPSTAMADVVRRETGRQALIIPDPVEGERLTPAFAAPDPKARVTGAGQEINLLWYGHPTNLSGVKALTLPLQKLASQIPIRVRLLTTEGPEAQSLCAALSHHGVPAEVLAWSHASMTQSLAWCHLAIIPAEVQNPRRKVKSANRLITALWAGRYVVTSPLPSHLPFAPYAWVGEDLCAGIAWACAHPDTVLHQISQAQDYIAQHFDVSVVAALWRQALAPTRR